MDYVVVYDVATAPSPVWFPAFGLIFVAIGLLLWRYRDRMQSMWHGPFKTRAPLRKAFAGVYLGFAVTWVLAASFAVLSARLHATSALSDGTAQVVEGVVADFHPMPYSGHDTERFRVNDVHFAYSDYVIDSAFNQTSSHGGPIREGLQVRIHFIGSRANAKILRLEIAR